MATNISRDSTVLTNAIAEIIQINAPEDGVTFDLNSLRHEPITVDKKYPGSRFSFKAHLDSIVFPMSVDIGFGDVISDGPISLLYPIILDGLPSIQLKAYSLETLVAEKFQTMIDRDITNSRMKDFFDCYQLIVHNDLDDKKLQKAIFDTFTNRGLLTKPDAFLFDPGYTQEPDRIKQWKLFLKKIKFPEELIFSSVVDTILSTLLPKAEEVWSH